MQTSTADGSTVVEWVATQHFYSAGTLLVLYVGDEQRTLDALERLLGPPFAGGWLHPGRAAEGAPVDPLRCLQVACAQRVRDT